MTASWLQVKTARVQAKSEATLVHHPADDSLQLPADLIRHKIERLRSGTTAHYRTSQTWDRQFVPWESVSFRSVLTRMPLASCDECIASLAKIAGTTELQPADLRQHLQKLLLITKTRRVIERMGDLEFRSRRELNEWDWSDPFFSSVLTYQRLLAEVHATLSADHTCGSRSEAYSKILLSQSAALREEARHVVPPLNYCDESSVSSVSHDATFSEAELHALLEASRSLFARAQTAELAAPNGRPELSDFSQTDSRWNQSYRSSDEFGARLLEAELEFTRTAISTAEKLLEFDSDAIDSDCSDRP